MTTTQILVVEDEKIIALDIQSSLQNLGYPKPTIVRSGQEALHQVSCKQPDLILMDIKLNGGIDGVTTAEQLQHRFDLPVVFLTSYADEATLQRAKQVNFYGYLLKPFEIRELHTTIEVALHRHHLERQLKESQRWLTTILAGIGEAVIATNAQEQVKFMNPLAEKLTGWVQTEALGRDFTEVCKTLSYHNGPGQIGSVSNIFHEQTVADQWQSAWLITLSGGLLPIEQNITPLLDEQNRSLGAVVVFRDVTRRLKARAEISRHNYEQQRLITAIQQADESIIITDTGGIVLYVNPAFEKVTGYNQIEVIGRTLELIRNNSQPLLSYQELWDTIQSGQIWRGRLTNTRKDETLFTSEVTISPVRDTSGRIMNFVIVARDVTRELALEEQYYQSQKLESIGLLVAGVAHDFNSLLTVINGFAELLYNRAGSGTSVRDMSGKILYSGKRAADLVNQLLAFSRKQIIEPKVLNLNTQVMEVNKILRRIISEQIRIKTRLSPDLWLIKADATQIVQIILNLAVNARDAMPNGGQLLIETANVTFNELHQTPQAEIQPGSYVQLSVSDTGVGMNKAILTRIFDPFFTTKGHGLGSGLGLSTVYGIVKQNGGYICVHSEEGIGTTFSIYWLCTEDASPAPNPPQVKEPVLPAKENSPQYLKSIEV